MNRILIVEDDQLVATAYRRRFSEDGWTVEWAPDGIEGIKAVGIFRPDVVLLDLLMPRLDGIEVLKYIRSNPDLRHIPVVVFSNSYMTNLIENAFRCGADQCLMKASTTPQLLLDGINHAMHKAAARKAEAARLAASPLSPSSSGPAILMVEPRRPSALAITPRAPDLVIGPSESPLTPAADHEGSAGLEVNGPAAAPLLDPEFQDQIRQIFVSGAASRLRLTYERAEALANVPVEDTACQTEVLTDLFRKVHSLTSSAAVAGCSAIAQYASTVEAFLRDLQLKPRFINVSTLRTFRGAIDFVALLFQHALDAEPPGVVRRVLVVDGDPMSGQTISLTLEKAGWRTHLAGDPIEAMALASTENFDLVIAATTLPGMSGFEASVQLQTLPGCDGVPVLFVSPLEEFEAHARAEGREEIEIIGRPFLVIELTLKVSTLVETRRFRTHFASAA